MNGEVLTDAERAEAKVSQKLNCSTLLTKKWLRFFYFFS